MSFHVGVGFVSLDTQTLPVQVGLGHVVFDAQAIPFHAGVGQVVLDIRTTPYHAAIGQLVFDALVQTQELPETAPPFIPSGGGSGTGKGHAEYISRGQLSSNRTHRFPSSYAKHYNPDKQEYNIPLSLSIEEQDEEMVILNILMEIAHYELQ